MYLSEMNLWNFRKYGTRQDQEGKEIPGLTIRFNERLNVIVGENDSGKTAIIDAIKLILNTHSSEFVRLDVDDFYLALDKDETNRAEELRIECFFRNLSPDEAKNFIEWLSFEYDKDENVVYFLRIFLIARRTSNGVHYDIKVGNSEEGSHMDGKARELLKITYLKPLRDAERELGARKNSRLSQILYNHDSFKGRENHKLIEIIAEANKLISGYFKGVDSEGENIEDQDGKDILEDINGYLEKFTLQNQVLKSYFGIADMKIKAVLEKLSLFLSNNKAGLGSQNLLFIATELLLLKNLKYTGLRLALIEEIEAHLHTQAQLRLIEYLQDECESQQMQVILTTHSPTLASKVSLKNLLVCKNDYVFNMSNDYTMLSVGDYLFLERFLDSTKANLFFANGVILVEGDAENILLPTIAKIMGVSTSKHGVSIVNVGSTAFLRYSNIFARQETLVLMGIPVSCITDLDVKPEVSGSVYEVDKNVVDYNTARAHHKNRKIELYSKQEIKCFVSNDWTLEYCIALGNFQNEFFKAVLYSKYIQNSDKYGLTEEKMKTAEDEVIAKTKEWEEAGISNEQRAYYIYNEIMLKPSDTVSKAIAAQCFSMILDTLYKEDRDAVKKRIDEDAHLKYLRDAIMYSSGRGAVE